MAALYELRNVERFFGAHCALSIESLDIPDGGLIGIVGPNGSGKTSLLRLLALLDEPTRGQILFHGPRALPEPHWRPVFSRPRCREQPITMVEQNPYLFRGTVELNVGYGPRALRRPKAECQRRTYDALEKVGAAPLLHRRVDRLSGGERRQVALARALAIAPRVLLLDEPFAELDREHTFKTEQLLRDRSGSTTVIFTTHDLAQAHRLASDVVSIIGGRISPGPLLNLFRGSVIRRAGGPIFCAQGIEFEIPESSPDATLASVDPDTIVVSTEPLRSSARNHYCGVITRVEARTAVFHLTIDCGAPVVATITRHSYDDLGLNAGRRVWVTFKSTAVRLY